MSKKVVSLDRAAKSRASGSRATTASLGVQAARDLAPPSSRGVRRDASARPRKSPPRAAAELGSGLHLAWVERILDGACALRLLSGERVSATIDEDVDPSLVADCLRNGRKVIVCATSAGPTIMGALQTAPALTRAEDGKLTIEARELRLRAERSLVIEAGPVALRVDASGALRLEGDRMIIDMGSFVRFLAGRVELP
jgi:hypothetical protein